MNHFTVLAMAAWLLSSTGSAFAQNSRPPGSAAHAISEGTKSTTIIKPIKK